MNSSIWKKKKKKKKNILSWRLGREKNSTAILPLPLIQEEQLSVTGERMCTKYWYLPWNTVVRVTDRARNNLKCVDGNRKTEIKPKPFQDKIYIIQISRWGDSIHIKLARYWCNWSLS